MQTLKQSSTAKPLVFCMFDSADHVTGKTGLSPTVVISKNGGSFASPSGSVTEIANGFYEVAGNATDTNTFGILALSATASGADQCTMAYEVVAYDPDDARNIGLSALPTANPGAANGLFIAGSNYDTSISALVIGPTTIGNFQFTGTALLAADTINAASIKADAVAKIQFGLSTFTAGGSVNATQWGGASVTGMPMPTYTQPTGFLAATFPTSVGTSTFAGGAVASVTAGVTLAASQSLYAPSKAGDAMALTSVYDAAKTAAPASTALSSAVWSSTKAGYIDLAISSVSSGSAPSAGTVAAAVWDLTTSGHTTAGTFGNAMSAAGSSGDPLATVLPGSYTEHQAGYILARMDIAPYDAPIVSIPAPVVDNQTTGYIHTRDAQGAIVSGIVLHFELLFNPSTSSDSFGLTGFTCTSDTDGLATTSFEKGGMYRGRRGSSTYWVTFFALTTDTFPLPAILGIP